MAKEKTKKQETLVIPRKDCPRATEISREEILRRAERIKPVVRFAIDSKGKLHRDDMALIELRFDDGKMFEYRGQPYYEFDGLYRIKPVDLFNIAFTWNPKPEERVNNQLVLFDDIVTHHSYAASALFKPTQAEVLAQIPKEYLDRVVAYEVVALTGYWIDAHLHGCHAAHTRLYIDQKTHQEDFRRLVRRDLTSS